MARVRINPLELQELLDAGRTQAEAARHFGVTEAAISLRVKKLRLATTKVVALERAHDVVDRQLTAAERLGRVQQSILAQLDWAEAQAAAPGADRQGLADTIVKLCGEARAQIRLEHDISCTLIDLKVVREFQQTVVKAISEEAPEVARRIVDRLKTQRALRHSAEWTSLDGRGGIDVA